MKTIIILTSIMLSLLLAACSVHRKAEVRDAERDFGSGGMRIETYGYPFPNNSYERYLSDQGVKVESVAGCIVDDITIEHAEGYNAKMKTLINQRFGRDIFKEARNYANKNN